MGYGHAPHSVVHIKTRLPLYAKGNSQYKNFPPNRTIYLSAPSGLDAPHWNGTSLATGHRENTAASCESRFSQALAYNVQQKSYPRNFSCEVRATAAAAAQSHNAYPTS